MHKHDKAHKKTRKAEACRFWERRCAEAFAAARKDDIRPPTHRTWAKWVRKMQMHLDNHLENEAISIQDHAALTNLIWTNDKERFATAADF
jgi:hypothetical protein